MPTLVPGVNTDQIGAIVEFARAASRGPGRALSAGELLRQISGAARDRRRITIPEIITGIGKQTVGGSESENFRPPGMRKWFLFLPWEFCAHGRWRTQALDAAHSRRPAAGPNIGLRRRQSTAVCKSVLVRPQKLLLAPETGPSLGVGIFSSSAFKRTPSAFPAWPSRMRGPSIWSVSRNAHLMSSIRTAG